MGWFIFMILAWSAALLLVPIRHWKRHWPVGIFGMASIYAIDSTLIYLHAFSFYYRGISVSGLPLHFWLSYLPGGIIFDYFIPPDNIRKPLYIMVAAALLLAIEIAMIYTGYFQHINWNAYRSHLLNVGGFIIIMWFAEWIHRRKIV